MKFGRVVSEIRVRTDRQTDTLLAVLRPIGGGVVYNYTGDININNSHDDIYGAVSSWLRAIAKVHPVHLTNAS